MRIKYAVSLAVLTGIGIGGAAVQTIHAQAKPPVYMVTEIDVTDTEGYMKEYLPLASALVKAHGGRILARGSSQEITAIAGEPPKGRVSIQVWDSMEQLQGWFNSPDYKKARAIGEKYAKYRNYAIPGVAQ